MNIRIFKLVSGEDVISEFENDPHGVVLKSPAVIVMQRTEQGVGVGLMPFMPYASGKINLHNHAIVSYCDADTRMTNEYNRIFGSGIEIASAAALTSLSK